MKYTKEMIERLEQELKYVEDNKGFFDNIGHSKEDEEQTNCLSNNEEPHVNSPEFLRLT
jgi:hypothetical protein